MDVRRTTLPIVVGVDDSEAGLRALDWAIDEALLRGCEVRALTVWAIEPAVDTAWTPPEEIRESYQARLDAIVREATADRDEVPPIVTETVEGPPARALVEAARDASLLVVATHRGQRLRKALLGSVSAACVRHATVPVVVVRPPAAQRRDGPSPGDVE